jgi:hypothetical protein
MLQRCPWTVRGGRRTLAQGLAMDMLQRIGWVCASASLVIGCGDAADDRSDTGPGCGVGSVLVGDHCVPVDPTGSESGEGSTAAEATTAAPATDSSTGAAPATTEGSSDGGAETSSTGEVLAIDLHDAILHDNPPDLADWPITTMITHLEFRDDGVYLEFSKKDGDGRWPDIVPPGWDGPLQYTVGLVERIDGVWHASAAIQYWYGLEASGGNVALDNQVAMNWYYDARWGEMAGHQPITGESIGVFVVAGNVRGVGDNSQSPAMERSDVVVVPMPDTSGAVHDF